MPQVRERYAEKERWLVQTVVEQGCSIGANATILPGVRLGRYCVIAAGAVVTKDVEPFALMMGAPARRVGTVCVCGQPLAVPSVSGSCANCQSEDTAAVSELCQTNGRGR
jgi:UDP-2-acetamido-3-amino-2,3-dideoxy-glucuronate N-acetyltransferase